MTVLRVLVSAFACDPTRGSERTVGWSWVKAAAELHEVVLITGSWNREYIQPWIEGTGISRVVYVDFPSDRIRRMGASSVGHYYAYMRWQHAAALEAARLHAEAGFDLVHHVTYGATWLPCFMYLVPAPLMLGPLGGAERCPSSLLRGLPLTGLAEEFVRVTVQEVFVRLTGVRRALKYARLCLAKTEESRAFLERNGAKRVLVATELSVPEDLLRQVCFEDDEIVDCARSAPSFIAVARLEYWKGMHLAIRAFELMSRAVDGASLTIVGDGPELERLKRLCNRLGVSAAVTFHPHMPRADVLRLLRRSTALVHPSLHDSSGNVLVEAMACGTPVVCLSAGGPAAVVPSDIGILVQPGTLSATVHGFSEAMRVLASDYELRRRLSEQCATYASQHYSEDALRRRLAVLYEEAYSNSPQRIN